MEVETIEAVLGLAERAHTEGARSMRAVGTASTVSTSREGSKKRV
jgi:hypothetical protein